MDKFYPKNFMLWRLHLILLLIFLEVVYDSTGMLHGVDLEAIIARPGKSSSSRTTRAPRGYKGYCRVDEDCQKPDFHCDQTRGQCLCRSFQHFDSKIAMYYHENSGRCLSTVGKVCTMNSDDGLWEMKCVPYAECVSAPRLPSVLGICQCQAGFEETEKHLCRPIEVIQVQEHDQLVSMAQVQTQDKISTDDGSMTEHHHVTNHNSQHLSPVITSESEDLNASIDVRDDLVENWEPNDYGTSDSTTSLHIPVSKIFWLFPLLLLFSHVFY